MSHIWMSHVSHVSHVSHRRVESHTNERSQCVSATWHVTHMHESCLEDLYQKYQVVSEKQIWRFWALLVLNAYEIMVQFISLRYFRKMFLYKFIFSYIPLYRVFYLFIGFLHDLGFTVSRNDTQNANLVRTLPRASLFMSHDLCVCEIRCWSIWYERV